MLRYLKYIFPAASTNAIALVKPDNAITPANANYLLNGIVARDNRVNFITQGYCRNISITALGHDYTGVNFTITGKQNGVSITEILAGADAGTAYSTNIFDSIESISANADTTNVSIGTGPVGFFKIIQINRLGGLVEYSLSLESSVNAAQIPTVVYTTVDNIENNGQTFQDIVANGIPNSIDPLYIVKASSQLTQYSIQYPYTSSLSIPAGAPPLPLLSNYYLVALNGDGTTLNSGMTLIFTQV